LMFFSVIQRGQASRPCDRSNVDQGRHQTWHVAFLKWAAATES
jgi:hypothetical protein